MSVIHPAENHPYSVTNLNESNFGILFEKTNNIHFYSDSWSIYAISDLGEFRSQFQSLLFYKEKIHEICNNFTNNEIGPYGICKGIPKQVNNTIVGILSKNRIIENLLGLSKSSPKHSNRYRRGLINLGGDILKTLFGTMSNQDAELISQNLKLLNENQDHLDKLMKQQTSVLKNSLHVYNKTFVLLSEEIQTLERDIFNITRSINYLQENQFTHQRLFEETQLVSEAFSLFILISEQFEEAQEELIQVILAAEQGKLHPLLFTPEMILEELQRISSRISEGLSFPIELSVHEIHNIYDIISLQSFHYDNKLCFVLQIPLINTQIFEKFRITPVPKFLGNQTFVFILPHQNFIAIDTLHEYFVWPTVNQLQTCKKLKDAQLCKNEAPIELIHMSQTCEVLLFISKTHQEIPDSCQTRAIKLKTSMFVQLSSLNTWLYLVPYQEQVNVLCERKTSDLVAINQVGIIKINPKCEIRTNTLILKGETNFQSNITTSYKTFIITNKTEIDWKLSSKEPLKTIQHSMVITSDPVRNLNELSKDIRNLETAENSFHVLKIIPLHQHIYITYSIIAIIITTGVTITLVKMTKCKCKRDKEQSSRIQKQDNSEQDKKPQKQYLEKIELREIPGETNKIICEEPNRHCDCS